MATRKITAPITSCSRRPVWPLREISSRPSTTVRVRAQYSHQTISSSVPVSAWAVSAPGGGSSGLSPALMISAL